MSGETMLLAKRLKARVALAVPLLTLVGTFGVAAAVHRGADARGALVGFAVGVPEAIAALEPSRVVEIHVEVGAEVEPNQLIAKLDTSAVDAEIAILAAEQVRLEAESSAERMLLGHRLDVDREAVEREARKAYEEAVRLGAEAEALDGELARVSKLVGQRQAVAGDLFDMTLRRAQLAPLERERPVTLGILTKQLAAAQRRRSALDDATSATAAKHEAELRVLQRRMELLEQRRASLFLRATRKGKVATLEKRAGETAAAGEPIVRVVSANNHVVVCVPERLSLGLREGDGARLWFRGQRAAPLPGRTVALGPMVSVLPDRCWPTPKLPVWGREVTVALDVPVDVVVGEAFEVVFEGRPAPPVSPSNDTHVPVAKRAGTDEAEDPAEVQPEPRPMFVPASLARRTRFEPSGVLARPDEGRYLVVSDDTGIQGGPDDGRPWLFSMSRAGAVDPTPIGVRGVSKIADLEAITEGAAGEIYVLSSQSRSKKGKRSAARSALLRLRSEARGFVVDGEVHLAELLDAAPETARALGLSNGTRDLDIEGMSFHGGALYLGLKSPLDPSGDAMIWRVESQALFEPSSSPSKRLETMSIWGRVRVDVELDGNMVPGGISALSFVGQGSLAIASTPSTAEGTAGALWRVERPRGGKLAAQLVRRFPKHKPEGLTRSLAPGHLLVVFDAGSATPSFLETPWPR